MEVALSWYMLWHPVLMKLFAGYFAAGLPALWFTVRWSPDEIDCEDTKLISAAYLFWPVFLTGVIAERGWQFTKFVYDIGIKTLLVADHIVQSGLKSIAGHAENKKRESIESAKIKKLEALEKRVEDYELIACDDDDISDWMD